MQKTERLWGTSPKILLLLLMLTAIFLGSFLLGRYPVTPDKVLAILASKVISIPKTWTDTMETVVLQVRFPRIVAALLVGGALSVSGAAYQNIFKNPLVSPAILGVSAGAGFGAAPANRANWSMPDRWSAWDTGKSPR